MSEGIFDRIQLSSKRKFQDYGYQSKPVDDLKTARIKKVSRSKSGGKRMSNKMLESTPKKSLDYDPIGMKSRVNQHVNGLTKDERIKEL